jgi:hypothetical protein
VPGPRHWAVDVKSRTERRAFLRVARTLAASHSGRARAPRCGHSTYGSRLLLLSHARGRAQRPQVEPAHGASARPLRHRFGAARTALAVLKNGCLASKQSHGVSFRLGATDNRSEISPDPCIQDPIRRDATRHEGTVSSTRPPWAVEPLSPRRTHSRTRRGCTQAWRSRPCARRRSPDLVENTFHPIPAQKVSAM